MNFTEVYKYQTTLILLILLPIHDLELDIVIQQSISIENQYINKININTKSKQNHSKLFTYLKLTTHLILDC